MQVATPYTTSVSRLANFGNAVVAARQCNRPIVHAVASALHPAICAIRRPGGMGTA
jgi:hypothetical protein